jgi:hypothetical protein
MNKTTTKELQSVINQLKNLPIILTELKDKVGEREKIQIVIQQLQKLEPQVEEIMFDYEEKADNLSDKARDTQRGVEIEETFKYLQKAFDSLQECITELEYSIGE